MGVLKLLIVDDDPEELEVCRATVKTYQRTHGREIELVESQSLKDAQCKIDSSFDGAIVDLKLGNEGDAGNRIAEKIRESFRIPVAIFTGTPQNATPDSNHLGLGIHKKGEVAYVQLFDGFFKIFNTGLTNIFGGRGEIEKTMNKVFWDNLLPQLDAWMGHVDSGKPTEKALLRFTLNHLMELLDEDAGACFPEEMYLSPPVSVRLRTGSIVANKESGLNCIVLTPSCDLVVRPGGGIKTDRIKICEIEETQTIIDMVLEGIGNQGKRIKKLSSLLRNNYSDYYHWMPRTNKFPGGFVNFRKATAMPKTDFEEQYNSPAIQVSSQFTKDIIARYAGFYARQGQPDFDFDHIAEQMLL